MAKKSNNPGKPGKVGAPSKKVVKPKQKAKTQSVQETLDKMANSLEKALQ